MRRMTIKFIERQLANLSADMKELTGKDTSLMLEQGSAYTSWKVCADSRGSRTLITAKGKQELSDKIYAAQEMIRFALHAKGEE